jgi:hypothetical protein
MLLPDISEFQPNADLAGIKKQNGGAVITRVGYGAFHKDLSYTNHRAAALKADFHFNGLYQYVVASQDVTAQAKEFVGWVGKLNQGEIPMADIEEGEGSQLVRATTWFTYVDKALGLETLPLNRRSWLYSGQDYASNSGLATICASARHTWIALYGPTPPALPHTLWQSTDGAQGVNRTNWAGAGYCDTNVTGYTLAELAATAWQPHAVSSAAIWNIHATSLLPTRATIIWEHTPGVKEWQVHTSGPGMDRTNNVTVPQAQYEGLKAGSVYQMSIVGLVNGHGVGIVGKSSFRTP